jgi:hypothetical protein
MLEKLVIPAGTSNVAVPVPPMLNNIKVGTASIASVDTVKSTSYINPTDATSTSNLYSALKNDVNELGHAIVVDGTTYENGIGMHPHTTNGGTGTATFDVPAGMTNFSSIIGMTSGYGNVNFRIRPNH